MQLVSKFFHELTTVELYEILKARSEVFVVEQTCIYQDLDDLDYDSLHVFFEEDGKIQAYLRAYTKPDEETVRMGRVLTIARGTGLGGRLLKEGLAQIVEKLNPKEIDIHAQSYAVGFYERAGFQVCSEEFMEDGIPHKKMNLSFVAGDIT